MHANGKRKFNIPKAIFDTRELIEMKKTIHILSIAFTTLIMTLTLLAPTLPVMANPAFSWVDYNFNYTSVSKGQTGLGTVMEYRDPNGEYFKMGAAADSIGWVWSKQWIEIKAWSEFVFTDPTQTCTVKWSYAINGHLWTQWIPTPPNPFDFANAQIDVWLELYDMDSQFYVKQRHDIYEHVSGAWGNKHVNKPVVVTLSATLIKDHRYQMIIRAKATGGAIQTLAPGIAVSDFYQMGLWPGETLRISWGFVSAYVPTGSCPFLYASNGTAYVYIAETMGPGGMGFPDASLRYDTRPPDPRDYIVLDADQLPAVDGKYVMELASLRDEVNYIDQVKLVAVDHPPGYDIYSPSAYTQIPLPFEYRTASNPLTPVSAKKYVYQWGQVANVTDILDAITYLDDFNYTVSDPNQFHTIELDFGDLGNLDDIQEFKLIIGGWLVIDHESIPDQIEFMKQHPELVSPPYIEVINETGMWEAVGEPICGESFWGPNSLVGTRILTRDIRHWLKTNDYRLRINYWGGYMMDWIAVDITDTPHEETTFTVKKPIKADLWYKGGVEFLPVEGDTLGYYADLPDWYTSYTYEGEPFIGNFTRYGNVKPLLKDSDDMFVITNYGDSIHLEFEEVPIPEGMERHYYLYIDGFYKLPFVKHLLNSTVSTVDPLPFHDMTTYPYPENESYPDDPIHRAYLKNWNTRYIGP